MARNEPCKRKKDGQAAIETATASVRNSNGAYDQKGAYRVGTKGEKGRIITIYLYT